MSHRSITFSTALDNRELEKNLALLTKKINKTAQAIVKLKIQLSRVLKDQQSQVSALQSSWDKTADAIDRYTAQLLEAENALGRQKEEAGELQRQVLQSEQARVGALSNSQTVSQRIVELNRELMQLKQHQKQLAQTGLGMEHQEYDNLAKKIAKLKEELEQYQEKLKNAQQASKNVDSATKKVDENMSKFGAQLKKILSLSPVSNLLSAGFSQFTNWVGKSLKTNEQAQQTISQLKGALLTLAQPLVEIIIPAFIMLTRVLAQVVTAVAQVVSSLFGKTLEQSRDGAKTLYKEAAAMEAVGFAADETAGSLAGFDEINTLGTGTSKESMSSDKNAPDFSGVISGELDKISALVGGALLTIGAILTFSGANFPLGISLMALGAAALATAINMNWSAIKGVLQSPIGAVTALISVALLALGALLAFSHINIALGISLMAAGAVGLVTVVAVNWNALSDVLQGPIGTILEVVSVAVLVIGALLAFSGINVPLGIALIALGAVTLATVTYLNWDTIKGELEGPLGFITLLVGSASLVLGAILAFSGVNLPLGIALIALGALGLATTVAANWNTIQNMLEGPVGVVTSAVSLALLALGAILTFSGAALPLGLGLMAAGAVGLAVSIAANWNTVQNALAGPVGAVTGMLSMAFLALGAILTFSGTNISLGIGLLMIGAVGLASSITANWETIQATLQGPLGTITMILSTALLVLGAVLLFSGAAIHLGLGLMAVGAVGLATALGANWDSITTAVGGTIQAITLITSAALLALGVIFLFAGLGPLGLGLLASGAVGLAATITPNWGFILEAVQGAWSDLASWWNSNAAKFFTLDYWADLGRSMIDGLLSGLSGIFTGLANWASNVWSTITGVFSGNNARSSISSSAGNSGATRSANTYNTRMAMPDVFSYSIPALAQGAVIPPNREFMAVLGDQRSGNNLETPEGLLRKIVREESGGGNTDLLQAILEAVRGGHIIMVDRRVLGQVVTQEQNRMTRQSGRAVVLG